jgi:hypothetical protein
VLLDWTDDQKGEKEAAEDAEAKAKAKARL